MTSNCRNAMLIFVLPVAWLMFCDCRALAQFDQPLGSFELSEDVAVDRADNSVIAQLQRAKAYLADRQWDEAVETFRLVMETSEDKLIGVTKRRYVGLRDYVHLQLASMPDEALKLYREQVDPVAKKWYEQGIARRDPVLLGNVLRQAFAGSYGDDALMALGEIALERGDYTSARWYWEQIIPSDQATDGSRTWSGFPDTDLDLTAVRARLVTVSILEGSIDRARDELTQFVRLHGGARGRLGGREVDYAEALGALIAESAAWPKPDSEPDWSTFAGNHLRNKIAQRLIDVGKVAWRIPICVGGVSDGDKSATIYRRRQSRLLQPVFRPSLSYYPLLLGDMVLVNNRLEILGIDLPTGHSAWGQGGPAIYRDQLDGLTATAHDSEPSATLGTPQFTMTACDGRLYARMGSPLTGRPHRAERSSGATPGYIVCLDLAAEGRLLWKIAPENGWAFEGSPLADGANVYIAMRSSDVRPRAHVACFDARAGRRRWRKFICGAETPARGMLYQNTHNLLTLQGETLYYNTNLGAVAAISAADGQVRWISLYPRAVRGDLSRLAPHWRRELTPCVYDRGTLFVAPADSPRIFAFDAAGGQMLWQTGTEVQDALHLLGTTDEHLIAGGGRIYWIGLVGDDRGRVKHVWPDGPDTPGHGRGVLAGGCVLWPTRDRIHVFDAKTARPVKVIDLLPRGASGGNLLVARGRLLITTGTELIAMSLHGGPLARSQDVAMVLRSRKRP